MLQPDTGSDQLPATGACIGNFAPAILHRIFRKNGENSQPRSLAFFVAFAAELLELGEHSADVHLARLFISFRSRSYFGLLARRGFGGRQQRCAGVDRCGLFLVGALDFEIKVDLRRKAERYALHRRQIGRIPVGAVAN
jgi:hypothetical protein